MAGSIYRKAEVAMWHDERFLALSAPAPNGRTLFTYLLIGPRTTIFPGLIVAREPVIAADLGWSVEDVRATYAEVLREGLARADWRVGVVFLTKALFDSSGEVRGSTRPASPNVLVGWAKSWAEIPDCDLKTEYLGQLERLSEALGDGFVRAFAKGFSSAVERVVKLSRNQEQDQEEKQELGTLSLARAHDPPTPVSTTLQPSSLDRHRKTLHDGWTYAAERHAAVKQDAIDPNARAWYGLPMGEGGKDLSARLRELLEEGADYERALSEIRHVVDVAEAESRATRSLRFFTPTNLFSSAGFSKKRELSVEHAANRGHTVPRHGAIGAAPPRSDHPEATELRRPS